MHNDGCNYSPAFVLVPSDPYTMYFLVIKEGNFYLKNRITTPRGNEEIALTGRNKP
jgi:hypothetical protein